MASKAKDAQAAELTPKAFDLRCTGMSYRSIGKALGKPHQTVFDWIQRHLKALAEETHEKAEQLRAIEHARLENLYRICMEGIHASEVPYECKGWVEQARKISESIRKLYGLDAPDTILHGESPDHPLSDRDVLVRLDEWMAERNLH